MVYILSSENIEYLKKRPETGMGYQVIDAISNYTPRVYIVFNGELAFDFFTGMLSVFERTSLLLQGRNFSSIRNELSELKLYNIRLEKNANILLEKDKGAKDGDREPANGDELFVRLSAFEDDIRIDKKNECLLPGSFTTTASDALRCKTKNDNPNARYALPNEIPVEWAFYINPVPKDILQRGIVQAAFGKKGGGREVYFENGTSHRTFITHTKW